jgi:hypothetical protein
VPVTKNIGDAPIIIENEDVPIVDEEQVEDFEKNETPLNNEQ